MLERSCGPGSGCVCALLVHIPTRSYMHALVSGKLMGSSSQKLLPAGAAIDSRGSRRQDPGGCEGLAVPQPAGPQGAAGAALPGHGRHSMSNFALFMGVGVGEGVGVGGGREVGLCMKDQELLYGQVHHRATSTWSFGYMHACECGHATCTLPGF